MFQAVALLVLLAAIAVEWFLPVPEGQVIQDLSETEKIAIGKYYDLSELLITWTLAVFAANFNLISPILGKEKEGALAGIGFVGGALCLCLASLYSAHIFIDRMTYALSLSRFPTDDEFTAIFFVAQYMAFASAVFATVMAYLAKARLK